MHDRGATSAHGATAALAAFCAGLRPGDLSGGETRAARRHFLDTLGACIAGAGGDVTTTAAAVLAEVHPPGDTPVPGLLRRWDMLSAAYLTGASGHGLELDDGYRAGSVHPGTVVVPALLALCWGREVDGPRLLCAMAAGYEVVTRIAEAAHPASRRRGFHNTSISGVFGAAAAAGSILGLDAAQIEQAFGIAASSSAGLFAFLHGGGEIKRLHPGMAAREGLLAALLARRGMTGPLGVLEGEDGFLQAFSGQRDTAVITAGLLDRTGELNITRCYLKPYPCCRHLHPGIDGLRRIMATAALPADAVARVDVGTYGVAVAHAGTDTASMASAQMSYPYCMAVALQRGDVGLDDFSPAARGDGLLQATMHRIHVAEDAACEATYPSVRPARVRVTTTDGRTLEQTVEEPSGSARDPLDDAAVADKFLRLAAPVLGRAAADRLVTSVAMMDTLADVDAVLQASARG